MNSRNESRQWNRRRLLKSLGVGVGVTGLAGCSQQNDGTSTGTTAGGGGTAGTESDETDATTQTETGEPKVGGSLTIAAQGDPQNLDPHTTTIDVAQLVLDNVVEELFELNQNLEVEPLLATDYQISEDQTTYTIPLKQGVTFHDGSELTSADVKYSIERILDPDLGSPRAANFELVDTIETPDDYTVVFELSKPFAPFIIGLAESAAILPEGAGEERNLKQTPVGTGPFTLASWETDDAVVLEKFEDYHADDLPYLDDATFSVIPEAATRLTQLQSGSADMMFGVPFQQVSQIKSGQGTTLQSVSGLWKQSFWFNTDQKPFDDPRVRRAISHAINRPQLVQGVLFGNGQVAHSPVPPTSNWRDRIENVDEHEFSRQQAESLFDEAGVDPASVETSIKASRTPGPTYADTATLIQSHLSQLGMQVDVEIMDFSTWLQEVWVDKNYQLSVGSWAGRIDPDGWYYRQYHSEGPWNRFNYSNDEVDRLVEEGRTTTDPAKRGEIYSEIERIVSEEAPMAYLYFREEMTGLKDTVGGYALSPTHQAALETVYKE
jgi:peptide/nickel transport system substrate-binding protein